jgi:hypothetical protein
MLAYQIQLIIGLSLCDVNIVEDELLIELVVCELLDVVESLSV